MRPGPKTSEPEGDTFTANVLAARTGENLDPGARMFRDYFVKEYVKDFNARAAIFRCGYQGSLANASSRASNLLREPYVSGRIEETVLALKPEDIVSRQQVMALMLKEATDEHNPGKVRVAALAHIATMLGMNKQKEDNGGQPIGVLLIPMMPGEDWNLLAGAAQKALKQGEVIDGCITPVPPAPAT